MLNYQSPVDTVFHALADPARRVMVERLCQGPASVSDLAEPLPMSLPAVMQHLKVLEDSGIVISEKQGRVRTCRVERAAFTAMESWICDQRALWERRLDRLGEYLDRMETDI
jgi:DNA-binding transcriptional ArsR family regulator